MGEALNSLLYCIVAPLFWAVLAVPPTLFAWITACVRKSRTSPKCILITGATSGIGEALAVRYARPGVTIAVCGRQDDGLRRVSEACTERGARVLATRLDIADRAGMARWIRDVDSQAPLQLVIANAGVTESTSGTEGKLEEAARAVFSANVDGVFNTIFPAIECMRARQSGQIAIMSSLASYNALTGSAAYSASKAAVRVYAEGLRAQLARDGISVTAICPGYVESPMTAGNKNSMPLIQTMPAAVDRIVAGLAADESNISFPSIMYVAAALLGAIPSAARDVLAKFSIIPIIGYMRKSRAQPEVQEPAAAPATPAPPADASASASAGSLAAAPAPAQQLGAKADAAATIAAGATAQDAATSVLRRKRTGLTGTSTDL